MRYAICAAVLAGIVLAGWKASEYFWDVLQQPLPRLQGLVGLAQASLTLLGLVVAGAWFLSRREVYPRAKLDLSVEHIELTSYLGEPRFPHLLNVVLEVENKGHVLLRTPAIRIYVYHISPLPTFGNPPVDFTFRRNDTNREYDWPVLDKGHAVFVSQKIEIEPGETEVISCDIGLEAVPDVIRVYAHITNPTKSGGIGWKISKIVRLNGKADAKEEKKSP